MDSLFALLTLACLGACVRGVAVPAWSWDHVNTYMHCANRTGRLWNEAAVAAMSESSFVVFEKNHGLFGEPKYTGAEGKISDACGQVDVPCLMYTESDLARTYYDLGVRLDAAPGAELACAGGGSLANSSWSEKANPLNASEAPSGVFHVYDFTNASTRARWVDRVATLVASGKIDGAFIDGNRNGWGSTRRPAPPRRRARPGRAGSTLRRPRSASGSAPRRRSSPITRRPTRSFTRRGA